MTKFEELVDDIVKSRQDLTARLDEPTATGATTRDAVRWFLAVRQAEELMEYMTVKELAEVLLDTKTIIEYSDQELVEDAIPDYEPEDDVDSCVENHAERCAELAQFITDYRK